jgi:GDP-4-dehydro-6-deoxy-D-mannose reductase
MAGETVRGRPHAALGGTVLVTGAGGFVGSYLTAALLADRVSVAGTHLPSDPPPPAAIRWTPIDLTVREAVAKLVAELTPSAVVHLAAIAVPRQATQAPLEALRSNYLAVDHLLDALRRFAPRARLLLVSSGEVYGRRPRDAAPAREDDPTAPEGIYGATKVAAERRAALAVEQDGLDVVFARPFNHTGPGRPADYAESSFARQIALAETGRSEPCVRVGNLEAIRDFCDVREVVRSYLLLLERGVRGATYNVCTGRGRSIRSLLEILCAQARMPVSIVEDPARYVATPPDRVALVGDPSRLEALGWKARIPLEETLATLLAHWRERS